MEKNEYLTPVLDEIRLDEAILVMMVSTPPGGGTGGGKKPGGKKSAAAEDVVADPFTENNFVE